MKTLTKTYLENLIEKSEYIRHENSTLTICVLTLKSGFVVTGESACISPENFDAQIGREIAYNNAFEKLWQLEGYRQKALGAALKV